MILPIQRKNMKSKHAARRSNENSIRRTENDNCRFVTGIRRRRFVCRLQSGKGNELIFTDIVAMMGTSTVKVILKSKSIWLELNT